MKIDEYKAYLHSQNTPLSIIEKRIAIIRDFIQFLEDSGLKEIDAGAGKEEVRRFAHKLIADKRNSLENFTALRDYAGWLDHRPLYVAFIEVMDASNVIEVLAEKINEAHGQEVHDRIFRETLPPLGADEEERCAYTRRIMEYMPQFITQEDMRNALFQVQHGLSADYWVKNDRDNKEKYRQCGNKMDEYLGLKRKERDALLTKLRDEGKLWYTTEINDAVLEFIKNNPEIEVGQRQGNKIYITKVPYNTVRYLNATDIRMKRYYACHCPIVREAILKNEQISSAICYCSLGFASHSLTGLDLEFKGEVLESALQGDSRCRFVFHLLKDTV